MTIRNKLRATLVVLFVFIVGLVGLNFLTFAQLEGDSPAVNASGSLFRQMKPRRRIFALRCSRGSRNMTVF